VGGSSPGQGYQETQPAASSAVEIPPAVSAAAQRALANPAASRMLTKGIQRAATTGGGAHGHAAAAVAPLAVASLPSLIGQASASPRNNSAAAGNGRNANANAPSAGLGPGRVAAAAQAFSSPKPAANPSNPNRLVPQKKFGDVDVSSAGAMFRSLRGSTAAKNAPPPTMYTPPAFSGKKASSEFAPPPMRRVPVTTPAPEPEEEAQPEPEEESGGAWAEALYDFTSEEATDLHLRAGERVWVTERTSSDWWTGQVDDRTGLFPATYVKFL